ncbi:UbiA prenyltransferase family protein [Thermococcus piezophilus]|uniref:4-hydroxybenzoate polyprenyltransferase n=1 Tax=Thermococcus piezophilus TaxID=1712654 RepID=A0A172WFN2_9EURY|nr:UbiA family prenyltransferase [Thermococcus piezophilus]ANF22136.1 4-hydroxybenzoate polyprenyltransferase [Thermococcus piezophilus]
MFRVILKNTRVLDGRAFFGIGLLGVAMSFPDCPDVYDALILVVSLVLYVAYAFAINNCFDADTDSLNPAKRHKNPVASGELSFRAGVISSLSIILPGILLSYSLGLGEFAIYLAMVALATVYSAPPRLKARPIIDVLSHGIFFGVLPFLYGAYFDGILTRGEITIAVAVLLYSFALELRNHLGDYESDLRAGLKTTPIVLGREASETLVVVFSGLSLVLLLASFNFALGALGVAVYSIRGNYRLMDAGIVALLITHLLGAVV